MVSLYLGVSLKKASSLFGLQQAVHDMSAGEGTGILLRAEMSSRAPDGQTWRLPGPQVRW